MLEGKRALVTGAGSGIGRATALALAAAGAEVVVQDIAAERVAAVAAAVRAQGGHAVEAVFDVADAAAMQGAVADARPVAILVNNAGVAGFSAPIEAIDRAAYERMFDVHVWGALNATRAVLPGMRPLGHGRIVNISSNWAQMGAERSSHYVAAKAALMGFTKGWARELAPHGINVNAVAPGVVRTAMTLSYGEQSVIDEAQRNLMKRWAEPEEIAAVILFLVGPGGAFMTGQVLCPNGGEPIIGI